MKVVPKTSYFLSLLDQEIADRIADVNTEEARAISAETVNTGNITVNAGLILVNATNINTNQTNITSNLGLININISNMFTAFWHIIFSNSNNLAHHFYGLMWIYAYRSFSRSNFIGGYSDHYPIYMYLIKEN